MFDFDQDAEVPNLGEDVDENSQMSETTERPLDIRLVLEDPI